MSRIMNARRVLIIYKSRFPSQIMISILYKLRTCLSPYHSTHSRTESFPFTANHFRTPNMPSIKKPPRHREEVVATILYFGILGVDDNAVSKLVELKFGIKVSPDDCRERLNFASLTLPQQGIPWTAAGVGEYITNFTTLDTFITITGIDGECKTVLGKASYDAGHSLIACTDCRS